MRPMMKYLNDPPRLNTVVSNILAGWPCASSTRNAVQVETDRIP